MTVYWANTCTAIHNPKRVSSHASLAGPATQAAGAVFLAPKAILAAFQSERSAERRTLGTDFGVAARSVVSIASVSLDTQ